jgi:hypothetical protein
MTQIAAPSPAAAMAEAAPQTSAGSKAEPAASAAPGVAELFRTVSGQQLTDETEAAQVLWARVKGYPHWPVGADCCADCRQPHPASLRRCFGRSVGAVVDRLGAGRHERRPPQAKGAV